MKISMIVAHGKNREIGLDNKMLWHIPEDFKNFKNITTDHHILMGRKTFESIGKALPNRVSLVLSKQVMHIDDTNVFEEIEEAIQFAKDYEETELFIIGGAAIYKELFNQVDKFYISEVDFEGHADSFFPEIDLDKYKIIEDQEYEAKENTLAWNFKVYEKI